MKHVALILFVALTACGIKGDPQPQNTGAPCLFCE